MARKLAIVRPLPLTVVASNMTNPANLLTPDPKEVATLTAGVDSYVDVDLGAAMSIDTILAGFLSSNIGNLDVSYGTVGPVSDWFALGVANQASQLVNPDYHRPYVLTAPLTVRYLRFRMTPAATDGTLGIIAVGKSIQPTWGHEFGAGRPIEDTGVAERLFSGGFGTYDGVRIGGYQWTFGDLYDAEVETLYALAKDRGTTRPVLVVEDPTQSDGLNERTHWGLLDRLEAYERQVPGASRYAFKVRDWV